MNGCMEFCSSIPWAGAFRGTGPQGGPMAGAVTLHLHSMRRVLQQPFQFIVLAEGLFTFGTSLPGYAHGGLWERLVIQALRKAVSADPRGSR